MGGPEGIANLIYKEFENAKPGSPYRGKVLDMMVRLTTKNASTDDVGDYADLDEAELTAMLRDCFDTEVPEADG